MQEQHQRPPRGWAQRLWNGATAGESGRNYYSLLLSTNRSTTLTPSLGNQTASQSEDRVGRLRPSWENDAKKSRAPDGHAALRRAALPCATSHLDLRGG